MKFDRFEIRGLDWKDIVSEGIPFDCLDTMHFFNNAKNAGLYPLVPRLDDITVDEIKKLWIPAKDKNITIVAEITDPQYLKVVGSGTLFVDDSGTAGDYHLTVNPDFARQGVGESITRKIIEESAKKGIDIRVRTSVHNLAVRKGMAKLGYWPISYDPENNFYKNKIIPPKDSALPPFATLSYLIKTR